MLKKVLNGLLNILGILAFICAIAYAVLVAYGYRIDFVSRSAIKTSIIHVANTFSDVSVSLNDEEVAHKTPAEINGVLPGLNNLKIEKEGYFTWEKELLVIEDFVTKLDDVFLVSKMLADLEVTVPVDFDVETFDVGEENIFFVSQNDHEIYVYDLNENLAFFVNQKEHDLAWNANNIYFANHKYLIFETSTISQIVEISENGEIQNVKEVVVPNDFYGFEIVDINGIKGVYLNEGALYMTWIDEEGHLERIDKIFKVNENTSWFKIISEYGRNFYYLNNEVYFEKENEFIFLDQNVNDLDVSSDNDFLIYLKGDYDIMLYDFELGDTILLEHFSDKIDDIELNTNNKQIVLKQGNNVSICDFDFMNCFLIDEVEELDLIFMLQQKSPQLLVMGDDLKIYNLDVQ